MNPEFGIAAGIVAFIAGLLSIASVAARRGREKRRQVEQEIADRERYSASSRTRTTNAQRDALLHPVRMDVKNLIDEITAEAMAEEWIEEVRNEMSPAVRERLEAKLKGRKRLGE
jgi:hypothetical protein